MTLVAVIKDGKTTAIDYELFPWERAVKPMNTDLPESSGQSAISDRDVQNAVTSFNSAIPDFSGLLEAEVEK